MLVSINWLKEFVDIKLKASELADRLTMSGFEVESVLNKGDDIIFDINVTPNRGDCLSIIGIARETAAITNAKVKSSGKACFAKVKQSKLCGYKRIKDFISVDIKDKARCPRYAVRVIDGVNIAPSPSWLALRLESCGIRSINNIVDAANYVMLETGQPFHAFDYRFIRGKKIIIDTPKGDINFVTLDGLARKIVKEDLLICDAEGPVALAGVMGGLNSEVKSDTKTIVLESACFNPVTVRRTAKHLGLQSESSKRFEKGVDPNTTVKYLNRLVVLIVSIAGGTPTADEIDIYPKPVKPAKVKLSLKEVNPLLGIEVKQEYIKKFFKALGIAYSNNICTVPTYRPDLTRTADLIEEAARLYGYEKIPLTMPAYKMSSAAKPLGHNEIEDVKEFLTSHGFFEAINYGFCSPSELAVFSKAKPVAISNPLGVEFSAMKTTLINGLLNNLKFNLNFGHEAVKLFELRPVFLQKDGLISEERQLAGIIYGIRSPLNWAYKSEPADFYDVKGICEGLAGHVGLTQVEFIVDGSYEFLHPQASSSILHNGTKIGFCGLLHPAITEKLDIKGEIFIFEFNWDKLAAAIQGGKKFFRPLPKFPSVRRDIALLVNEDTTSADVLSAISEFASRIIKSSLPFDLYKGKGIPEGRKSVAYAVFYSDPSRTLTDEEVNETHAKLAEFLKNKLGAEIR